MANLSPTPEWVDVYQLEQTDPVLGGIPNESTGAGMDNIPHLHLAKRTSWLKQKVDALIETVVSASTSAAGIVRLSNTLTSTATDLALTAAQGKALNDSKAPKADAALTGTPTAPSPLVTDNSTKIATTAWVRSALSTLADVAGFSASLTAIGYIRLPSWLGGLIVQWGYTSVTTVDGQNTTLPITYPSAHLQCICSDAGDVTYVTSSAPISTSQIRLYARDSNGSRPVLANIRWISLGY